MSTMLEIDGSYGEGGGQIVRTAVALSVLTKQPVFIKNIRARRPIPGLRPQHFTVLKCLCALCDAEVEGLVINSTRLTFIPKEIKPGTYFFDVGTAGSMTLVFQACLLSALNTTAPLTIRLRGGTDVRWAPSWDYFSQVFLKLLQKIGVNADVTLEKRGYYPTGGGEAHLTIHPMTTLSRFDAGDPQSFHDITGIIHCANLPDHISTRMKHAVLKTAVKHHLRCSLQIDSAPSASSGAGITLWSSSEKTILGSTVLGEKNISAETVGQTAAHHLIQDILSGATVDCYGIDQILPYLVVAPKGSSCRTREITTHMHTNMWLVKQFFPVDFEVLPQQQVLQMNVI